MKWLFRRNKKEKPIVSGVRGNKHLTKEQKHSRLEAQDLANILILINNKPKIYSGS